MNITRNCYLKINLDALRHNLLAVRKKVGDGVRIIAVVKSNGYGHGMTRVSKELIAAGAGMLAVAFAFEGRLLRKSGITAPILVLGGISPKDAEMLVKYSLIPAVGSIRLAERLDTILKDAIATGRAARNSFDIHINLDTGMSRLGLTREEAIALYRKSIQKNSRLKPVGIMTHFAESDLPESRFTAEQLMRLHSFFNEIGAPKDVMLHAANSGAIINQHNNPNNNPKAMHLHAVRPGIMLYGCYDDNHDDNHDDNYNDGKSALRPAAELCTEVIDIKTIKKGETIGYGRTFKAHTTTRVAILPVGYGDGYPRILSNRSVVQIEGQQAPLLGRVSMDTLIADITGLPDVSLGDSVRVIGGTGPCSAAHLAKLAGTIPYEILTSISSRVPRVYAG